MQSDPHFTSYLMVLKVSKVLKVSQDLAVFPQDFQDFIFVKTLEALFIVHLLLSLAYPDSIDTPVMSKVSHVS